MTVLVTGATGFVGRYLIAVLQARGYKVRAAVRQSGTLDLSPSIECVAVGDVSGNTDWSIALEGVDCVIHLVARTHKMAEHGVSELAKYRDVNVEGTRCLAEAAVKAGVRRLVFLSSIKVNGERTTGSPFIFSDVPAPEDAYGISKWEAENVISDITRHTGLEAVIVRAPLIYGPHVKGNFARLMRWVCKGVPLPFGAVNNRRSLVSLPNLADLLVRCIEPSEAAGQTFLVSDGRDVSTPELVRILAAAMNRSSRLVPVPPGLLTLAGRIFNRQAEVGRLLGSLQVDIEHTCKALGWRPPVSVERGIQEAVAGSGQGDLDQAFER